MLQSWDESPHVFTFTSASLSLNRFFDIDFIGLKALAPDSRKRKWLRDNLKGMSRSKLSLNLARLYLRITGLERGKPSHDVTCDEVEAYLRIGIAIKHSHKLTPIGWVVYSDSQR